MHACTHNIQHHPVPHRQNTLNENVAYTLMSKLDRDQVPLCDHDSAYNFIPIHIEVIVVNY